LNLLIELRRNLRTQNLLVLCDNNKRTIF